MGEPEEPGILTGAQRAWLRGEKDPNDSYERQLKRRTRNRVAGAVRDMALLGNSDVWDGEEALREDINGMALRSLEDGDVDDLLLTMVAFAQMVGGPPGDIADAATGGGDEGDSPHQKECTYKSADRIHRREHEAFIVEEVAASVGELFERIGHPHLSQSHVQDGVIEFFESYWPDKDRAVEIAEETLADE